MASIDTLFERIFSNEGAWKRVLLGGLLCLSIVGIPVAAGYLFRYALHQKRGGNPDLPPWQDWPTFIRPGFHFLGVFAAWFLGPLLVGFLAGWLLELVSLGLLWWAGYLVSMAGLAVAPLLCLSALAHYQEKHEWSALRDFRGILLPLRNRLARLVVPALIWTGLIMLFLPLLPFAFFLGFLLLSAYLMPQFEQG